MLNDWYNEILENINAWHEYRSEWIDDEIESQLVELANLVYQTNADMNDCELTGFANSIDRVLPFMRRRTKQIARRKFATVNLTPATKTSTHVSADFEMRFGKFTPSKMRQSKNALDYKVGYPKTTNLSLYHVDLTGLNNYQYKYNQVNLTPAEKPTLANKVDVEKLYGKTTVRQMRKKWKGVSRVFKREIADKALYNARYSYRALNTYGKKLLSIIVKTHVRETAMRSLSHVLIRKPITTVETVERAVVIGLESTYLDAARVELKRQTSKSSATIDAWDLFGTEDLSALVSGTDWTDLKQVLLKFGHLDDEIADFIANVWEQYKQNMLEERHKSEYSSARILSAEDINNLKDADLSYMNPDY